ncbi:HNH endonuclease [Salipaludibacillus sp. CF4.18]|uniref:HNH endonuclease n=1 Tax=Salipaludibacillus sp. CF4.18 TaxID=3373081 RepID=UPI003EE5031A
MPSKPLKTCNKIGCSSLTKGKYCDEHEEHEGITKAESNKQYDMYARDQKSRQFYNSSEWKAVRNVARARVNNLCEICLNEDVITVADVADHIIPIKVNWNKRLELSNIQMCCHFHHNLKTQEDKRKYKDVGHH